VGDTDAAAVAPETPEPVTRGEQIMVKCGTTAEARSAAILDGLASFSDSQALETEGSPQYLAREWIDNMDGAVWVVLPSDMLLPCFTTE
jgi:hypothetical protein